jgi:hypothetical protein
MKQKGFAPILIVLIVAGVLAVAGGVGYYFGVMNKKGQALGGAKNETELDGKQSSAITKKEGSGNSAEYKLSRELMDEQLKNDDAWKLYVNPEIHLSFKYPPLWNISEVRKGSNNEDPWTFRGDIYSDWFRSIAGDFNISIYPNQNKDLLSVRDYLGRVEKQSLDKITPYGEIAGVEAVSIGNKIYLTKGTYFLILELNSPSPDIARKVADTFVLEPSLENLTSDQKAVFQMDSWQSYVNPAYGFAFMYPSKWTQSNSTDFDGREMSVSFWGETGLGNRGIIISAVRMTNGYESALQRGLTTYGRYASGDRKPYAKIVGVDAFIIEEEIESPVIFFSKGDYVFVVTADHVESSVLDDIMGSFIFK